MSLRPTATACILAALTIVAYSIHSPTQLTVDEKVFADQSRAIASTPSLFIHVGDEHWLQPAAVYSAAIIRAAGGGDRSGRIASTIVGAINVALVFIAVRTFAAEWIAVLAALLLMGTPAHWWYARLGTDAIFPVPFVLLWLIAMLRFIQFDSPRTLALATLALGVGLYTHPTAPMLMSWLWIATVSGLIVWRRLTVRNAIAITIGFGVCLIPAATWFALHPATYNDTFGRWAIFAAHLRFPMDGLRAQMNWNTVGNRTSVFWGLLDPSFLFFASETRVIAPFLLCVPVLVGLGVARLLTSAQPDRRLVLFAAVLVPPIVASTFGQEHDLGMMTAMTGPLAVIAGQGLESLKSRPRYWTAIVVLLFAVSVYQLAAYHL